MNQGGTWPSPQRKQVICPAVNTGSVQSEVRKYPFSQVDCWKNEPGSKMSKSAGKTQKMNERPHSHVWERMTEKCNSPK